MYGILITSLYIYIYISRYKYASLAVLIILTRFEALHHKTGSRGFDSRWGH
jgi:hypothetical protein